MSTVWIIFGIIVCVFIAIALFTNIGADYTKKTDQQLLNTWRFHEANVNAAKRAGPERYKQAVEKMSTLMNEMKRRGLLGDDAIPSRQPAADSHPVQLAANRLRIAARDAYERAFTLKQAEGRPERVCYTIALTNVLYSRLQASPGAPPASDAVTEVILMECAPFKDLTPQEGMIAIVEYVVWREYPSLANENLISSAVRKMKPTLTPDLAKVFRNAPFPWVKFL